MDASRPYRIGEIAERTGVSVETLRYYEKRRLLNAPARTQGGYRVYSDAVVHQVKFIKQAQSLGLTLEDIQQLVAGRCAPTMRPPAGRCAIYSPAESRISTHASRSSGSSAARCMSTSPRVIEHSRLLPNRRARRSKPWTSPGVRREDSCYLEPSRVL